MNLLFSITPSFVPLLGSCLRSILKNGGADRYTAYILHSGLSPAACRTLEAQFGPRLELRFLPVDERLFDGFPEFKRYPRQIYYRLAAPLLLPPELDRILYLDVDTVVINPLGPLYNASFDGACFMACTNTRKLLTRVNQLRLGAGEDVPYINSGVLMMDLAALRRVVSMEQIRRYANEMYDRLVLPDQDILTALYGDRVKLLDSLVYNLSDRTLRLYNATPGNERRDLDWVRRHTVIVHYFGRNKPWKAYYHGVLGTFYYEFA